MSCRLRCCRRLRSRAQAARTWGVLSGGKKEEYARDTDCLPPVSVVRRRRNVCAPRIWIILQQVGARAVSRTYRMYSYNYTLFNIVMARYYDVVALF